MIRGDPALRQASDHQQLAQMPSVSAISLGTLLATPQRARLRRLSQVHPRPDPPQLLDHEPPPSHRLQPDLQLLVGEPSQEPSHTLPIGRHDAREISPVPESTHSAVICARC